MTATERTHKRRRKHGLEAKAEEFSAFAAHSWASGTRTGTKRPDRSCGCWLGLGDWGMREIFHFALMRRRVRHGALTIRLRSHLPPPATTPPCPASPSLDTF